MFVFGFFIYPHLPEKIAIHWGINGQADGFASKEFGLLFLPAITAVIYAVLKFVPRIDPLKKNIEAFRKYYDRFVLIIVLFMVFIHLATVLWNFNNSINIGKLIFPAIGVLIFYIGAMFGRTKRNWFFGIRTPWTLSNDLVWDKTHRLGSHLFKISGLTGILGFFWPEFAFWLFFISIITSSIVLIIYSYIVFRGLDNK